MAHNPFSLKGKTILVTGASSGIGRATAIECSRMGAHLFITGRDAQRLKETGQLLEGAGHEGVIADLSDSKGIEKIIDAVPQLDGFVPAAGFTKLLPTQFIHSGDLSRILQVNTQAPILLTKGLVKNKKLNKGASVVFVSSIAGVYSVSPGNAMYSASKGAIQAFMKSAALELASKKIRCNAVNPGLVNTNILSEGTLTNEQLEARKALYPMKRFGEPEEVAYAIIYLLSDAAGWVTGSSLLIDGGFTLQ